MPISEYGKRYLMERYGYEAPKRIEVHRLGVFDQGLNFQKESETFRIVSCSNMVPVKRVSLLAEAIGNLGFKVAWNSRLTAHPSRFSPSTKNTMPSAVFPDEANCSGLTVLPSVQMMSPMLTFCPNKSIGNKKQSKIEIRFIA